MPREQFIIIGFFLVLCIRLLTGPAADLLVAATGALLLPVRRGAFAGALPWGALALFAVAQVVAPAPFRPVAMEVADWFAPGAPVGRWSNAPWETLRWAALFAGAACWVVLLRGGRRQRRAVGWALRALGLGVAACVVAGRAVDSQLIGGGENHIATFLAMAAAEPVRRLRGQEVAPWLSVLFIGAAIGLTGAVLPLLLLVALVLWSVQPPEARARYGFLGARVVMVLAALLSATLVAAASGRLLVWRDAMVMVGDVWPWGVGIGTFHWGFPAWAWHLPAPAGRALHPESSVLWWLIEAGLPGVLLLLLFRAPHTSGRAGQAARWALVVLALESLIEVPLLWGPNLWLAAACFAIGFADREPAPT